MAEDFHLREYEALRNEMLERVKQIGDINKFFLISVTASIAWLLNTAGSLDKTASFIGAWLPYCITVGFSAYRKDLSEVIQVLASYLEHLERKFGDTDLGWQTHLKAIKANGELSFRQSGVLGRLISIFTLIFAFYYASRYSLGFILTP